MPRKREYVRAGDTSVDSLHAELALLAARLVLPGLADGDSCAMTRAACPPASMARELRVAVRTAWRQYYTGDYLRTRKRRMVTASDRVLLTGFRSILARPGEE